MVKITHHAFSEQAGNLLNESTFGSVQFVFQAFAPPKIRAECGRYQHAQAPRLVLNPEQLSPLQTHQVLEQQFWQAIQAVLGEGFFGKLKQRLGEQGAPFRGRRLVGEDGIQ